MAAVSVASILYHANMLQLFEEASKIISSNCILLLIPDFDLLVDLKIIVEYPGGGHQDTTARLVKVASTYDFLSHIWAISQNLNFG